jgi:hypoxanthine phosphoribosyltransferase
MKSKLKLCFANHNRPLRQSSVEFPPSFLYHPVFPNGNVGHSVEKLRILLTREQIAQKVAEMAARISHDFAGEPVVLIGVLKGATIFLADLARQITLDATFDFIAVSSYGNAKKQSGEVKLMKDVDHSMEGKNIILVEDILDTGVTLTYLQGVLQARRPKSLRIAALLDKSSRRTMPVRGDYVGFEIPDEFVVGYGLDFGERYRNLPDVCVLESDSEAE